MGKRSVGRLASAVVINLLLVVAAWGQNSITSTIVGRVNDPSGAAVPDARVTATNTETGIASQGRTGSSGDYSIPELQPGTYSVTVSKSGFESYQVTGIGVFSNQQVRVDVQLKMGTSRQVVSVTGSAPLVHTDVQNVTTSIPTRIIDDLPKSTQAIDTLLGLVPGLTYNSSSAEIGGSSYWGGNDWNLNGTSVQDATNGRGQTSTIGMNSLPSTNALQEFKVDSGAANAEYREATGVTMVLKQGTNSFHGEAYGYFENRDLNANAFLNNAHGVPRSAYDRDQYGGLIGGPIIKNKLFFFADFFHFRQVSPSIVSQEFPSQAMRQGNFSALCNTFAGGVCTSGTQLYNPQTGAAFANNNIGNTFNTSAAAILAYLPLPNLTTDPNSLPNGGPNYQAAIGNIYVKNNLDTRMDWTISPKDSINGFYRLSNSPKWFVSGGYTPTFGNYEQYRDQDTTISATEVHAFGATAINEFHGTWGVYRQQRQGQNSNIQPWSLVPGIPVQATFGLPTVTMTGYTGPYDYGTGTPFPMYTVEFGDNFTKTHGSHTFKAGVLESGYKFSVPVRDGALTGLLGTYNGAFATTGAWTGGKGWPGITPSQGNAFADFLLGDLSSDNYALLINSSQFTSREWEGYAQDTWQATPKLTVNYGVRYMFQGAWQARNLIYAPFDLSTSKLMLLENGSTPTTPPTGFSSLLAAYPFETSSSVGIDPSHYYLKDAGNWQPRVGFAWRPFGGTKTVFRGGFGMFYNFVPSEIGTIEMTFNPPFNTAASYATNLPATAPVGGYLPDLTFANPFPTGGAHAPTSNPQIYTSPRNMQNPRLIQWTMTGERQFGQQWMVRATYLGEQVQHVYLYADNINQPPVQQPNVVLQKQRLFQPWGAINYNAAPSGIQNFNQLQLEVIKRFSNGLSAQVEYNWTRTLDDVPIAASYNNPWCYSCEYGPSDYQGPQRLVFDYVYELPVGVGRHWMNQKGVLNAVLGGWSVSGITTYTSGTPTSGTAQVDFTVPTNVIGWWGGRADRVAGVPLYAGRQKSHDIVDGVQWFNPAAFAPPQKWTYGDAPRNVIWGPGSENWDMSLMKVFAVKEAIKLQVRTDWFDAFNHFNLSNPSASPGLTLGDTRDGGVATPNFGKTYAGSGSRVIQLAVRLMF